MTKLLVSVRNAEEALLACAGGADLIDVKEPTRGALGAADSNVIEAVVAAVAGRVPTSAALGELREGNQLPDALARSLSYVKFGLAGCAADASWSHRWQQAIALLPPGVLPVAVAYADWQAAAAPSPEDVLSAAREIHCGGLLIDTFDKTRGPLDQHLSVQRIGRLIDVAHAAGMIAVLAGGLRSEDLPNLLALEPDYIGVRGAVCRGSRTGVLEQARVTALCATLSRWQRQPAVLNR
jgi:uncharacterized protein (UPF0264 family)